MGQGGGGIYVVVVSLQRVLHIKAVEIGGCRGERELRELQLYPELDDEVAAL